VPCSASINCSSSPVPSVVTTSACVSPRVNRAEPWARGSTPTSATIGRTVLVSRPSMRWPVFRMLPRTISLSSFLNSLAASSGACSSSASLAKASAFTAAIFSCRTCFRTSL